MASTTAYASLSVPAPEDTMEVSSPANRHFDGDIDIDFEDSYDAIQFTDDERMLEDEHTRPGTATDEMMQDDEQTLHALVSEEVMQDDDPVPNSLPTHQDEDDELIDYDDEEYMEDNGNAANVVVSNVTGQPEEAVDRYDPEPEQSVEAIALPEVEPAKEPAPLSPAKTDDHVTTKVQQPVDFATEQEVPETADNVDQATNKPEEPVEASANTDGDVQANTAVTESTTREEPDKDKASPVGTLPKVSIDVDTSNITQAEGPPTPSDTGLHPMTIQWRGQSMPLFKSRVQLEGLLKDDNLVNLSLADLLSNCRERLATKLGASVPSDEELVLNFEALGLNIVEDSQACFATSLNDILEVFLQLHQNDGVQEIPSLSLSLSLQPKFNSLLTFLKESAAQGQGMSIAEALYNATNEDDFFEEGDATGLDGNEDEINNAENENEGPDHYGTSDQTDVQHNAEEPYLEDQEDNDQNYYNGEDAEEYGDDQDNGEHESDPNNEYGAAETTGDHEDTDVQYEFAQGEDPTDDNAGEEEFDFEADVGEHSVNAQAEDQFYSQAVESANQAVHSPQSKSAPTRPGANSAKVRTNIANGRAGEYPDDDLIDFDDLDLTWERPKADTGTGQEGTANLKAVNHRNDDNHPDLLQSTAGHTVEESDVLESLDAEAEDQDAFYLDSDALLNDEVVQNVGEGLDVKETEDTEYLYNGDAGEAFDEYDTNDQANDPSNGNEDNSVQPGENEDDEQFHTAYDLLDEPEVDGDHHEPAPEDTHADDGHELYGEDEINFDDEVDFLSAEHNSAHDSAAPDAQSTKRAFDTLAGTDDDAIDEHEAKKARAA